MQARSAARRIEIRPYRLRLLRPLHTAHGVYEVYFSSYTRRACAVIESQSHKRAFVTDNRFDEAKAYYHTLLNELTE